MVDVWVWIRITPRLLLVVVNHCYIKPIGIRNPLRIKYSHPQTSKEPHAKTVCLSSPHGS